MLAAHQNMDYQAKGVLNLPEPLWFCSLFVIRLSDVRQSFNPRLVPNLLKYNKNNLNIFWHESYPNLVITES
jgi:hypothetical protein